jgi:hypothetical protein
MIGVAHGALGVATAISFGRQPRADGFGHRRVRCEMERFVREIISTLFFSVTARAYVLYKEYPGHLSMTVAHIQTIS